MVRQRSAQTYLKLLIVTVMLMVSAGKLFSQMAVGKGKFLGNVWGGSGIPLNYDQYWNQITPENASKWGSVEGTRNSYNWGRANEIYEYCLNKQYPFKFHTLIWGQQYPNWLTTLDSASIAQEVEEWIRLSGVQYISASFVDVVNEPLFGHNPPPATVINALGGTGATGWDWVIRSFELARQYWDKGVKLILNDFSIINSSSATAQYLVIINLLKDRGLIDGIGVQCHSFEVYNTPTATLQTNLNSLAATGLPIYISEFDINDANDTIQLDKYKSIFPVLWNHPGVKGITFWGYIQNQTWQPNAYLITSSGAERPAMQWLKSFMASIVSDVSDHSSVPTEFALFQNYPNPFNPTTVVSYQLPVSSHVTLKVYNLLGEEIATLVAGEKQAGSYTVQWDARNYSSGVYVFRLEAGGFAQAKKLIVLR